MASSSRDLGAPRQNIDCRTAPDANLRVKFASEEADPVKIIALEEHMTTPWPTKRCRRICAARRFWSSARVSRPRYAGRIARSRGLAAEIHGRVRVDMQVLSLVAPGPQGYDATTGTRSPSTPMTICMQPASGIRRALPVLRLADGRFAARLKEFERCVTKLGFKGAMINGTSDGEYPRRQEILADLRSGRGLSVPIYLHPRNPCWRR